MFNEESYEIGAGVGRGDRADEGVVGCNHVLHDQQKGLHG